MLSFFSRTLRKTFSRQLGPALAVGVSGFILWLAFPIFWNSLIAQRSIDTVQLLGRGDSVTESRLRSTLTLISPGDRNDRATGDRLVDQSTLSLALALELSPDDPERVDLLRNARSLTLARLEEAPADPHSWARLAYASYFLNGPSLEVFDALRMSYRMGPYEYYLLWPRLRLGTLLWPFLDEELRQRAVEQAALLWRVRRDQRALARFFPEMPPALQERLREEIEEIGETDHFLQLLERENQVENN